MHRRPFYITTSGILGTILALGAAAVCVRLGIWQLDRLHQRRAHNAAIEARMDEPPRTLRNAPADTAGLPYRRVRITGTYDHEHDIALASRSYRGLPGVYLISPLRSGDGAAVLVERGWVQSADAWSVDTAPFRTDGAVTVDGMALPFPDVAGEAVVAEDTVGFQRVWLHLDRGDIADELPYPIAPVYIRRLRGDEPAPSSPTLLAPPELGDGPHLSYAIQWFSFASIAVIGWIVILLRSRGSGDARAEASAGSRNT